MIAFTQEFLGGRVVMTREESIMTDLKLRLTPEEDSIGDPDEQDDEIDDLLPADLWFHNGDYRPIDQVLEG
jgi:hypothetical protein